MDPLLNKHLQNAPRETLWNSENWSQTHSRFLIKPGVDVAILQIGVTQGD